MHVDGRRDELQRDREQLGATGNQIAHLFAIEGTLVGLCQPLPPYLGGPCNGGKPSVVLPAVPIAHRRQAVCFFFGREVGKAVVDESLPTTRVSRVKLFQRSGVGQDPIEHTEPRILVLGKDDEVGRLIARALAEGEYHPRMVTHARYAVATARRIGAKAIVVNLEIDPEFLPVAETAPLAALGANDDEPAAAGDEEAGLSDPAPLRARMRTRCDRVRRRR